MIGIKGCDSVDLSIVFCLHDTTAFSWFGFVYYTISLIQMSRDSRRYEKNSAMIFVIFSEAHPSPYKFIFFRCL
jgi:hypothetical protein